MKNTSFIRWLFRFSGSIKLAMLLLAVLIVAIITGTFVESRLDTSVAQSYVYDAPWFMAWLLLLCVNLVGAVLVRYPWKPHQLGFVITHAGIVIILVGAIIGRIGGFEGSITLFKDQAPANFLLTGRQTLEVKSGSASKSRELNFSRNVPSLERPEKLKLGELEVAAIEFAPELGLRSRIEKTETDGSPALRLVMTSAMVRQKIDRWLLLDNAEHGEIEIGPAIIRYASAPAATETKTIASDSKQVPSREVHFAFAKMPEMGIVRTSSGAATGLKTSYQFAPDNVSENYKGKIEIKTETRSFTFLVNDLVDREISLEGTPYTLKFLDYFADLRMQGKEPVSVSDQPNNPAVLFEILGPLVPETSAAEIAHHQHGDTSTKPAMAELNVFRDTNGKLRFESRSRTKATHSGEIKVGEDFSPGLADWKCRVEEVTDHAVARHELAPVSDEVNRSIGASGLLIRSRKGPNVDTRWIRMGTPTDFQFAGENIGVTFAHKLQTLPFTIELEKFEVEMNEGTSTPASFKSYVRFHDPKKETTLTRAVWMNHPANFPEFAGAGLLGTSYKFSQASWNPDNLNETTLQVIRDPGWSLKWIGSLLLCGGLFTMFYLKPYPRFAQKTPAKTSRPLMQPEPFFRPQPKIEEGELVGK